MDKKIAAEIRRLREKSPIAFVGSVNESGFPQIKAMLWRDGCEMYYPKGVDDDDYCV